MKELDTIRLKVDMPDMGLSRGQKGTIIDVYEDGEYEVEFVDEEGVELAIFAANPDQIQLDKSA